MDDYLAEHSHFLSSTKEQLVYELRHMKELSNHLNENAPGPGDLPEYGYDRPALWSQMHRVPSPVISVFDFVSPEYYAARAERKRQERQEHEDGTRIHNEAWRNIGWPTTKTSQRLGPRPTIDDPQDQGANDPEIGSSSQVRSRTGGAETHSARPALQDNQNVQSPRQPSFSPLSSLHARSRSPSATLIQPPEEEQHAPSPSPPRQQPRGRRSGPGKTKAAANRARARRGSPKPINFARTRPADDARRPRTRQHVRDTGGGLQELAPDGHTPVSL